MPWRTARMSGHRGNIARLNAVPWYLSGDVPSANCIAAYQPKGAANYVASKVNLVNPGMYDLSDGIAFPTWDAVNGWTFVAASLQYLTIASAIMTGVPISMVCRFNADDVIISRVLLSICDTAATNFFIMQARGVAAGDPISAFVYAGVAGWYALSTSGYSASSWYTGATVFTSSVLRAAYINGSNKGTDVTDLTPAGLDTSYIGVYNSGGGLADYFNGKISACAFYNIALSDAQVLSIHNAMAAL